MKKLNLGSGRSPLSGFLNVDISPDKPGVDIVHDLNKVPWPFGDSSVVEVVITHCLEHLDDKNLAMREIYRVLKPGGVARIIVPHFAWQLAYADPTHRHFFAYPTFFYYTDRNGYFDFTFSSCDVSIEFGKRISLWNYILEPIANRFPTVYEQSPLRVFPAINIKATLIK